MDKKKKTNKQANNGRKKKREENKTKLAQIFFFLIWNRVVCQRSEERSRTQKRLKERFLNGQNRTKRANFQGKPPFQATYNNATENS